MEVPHGGGRRIKKDDYTYDVLRDWIAQGCQARRRRRRDNARRSKSIRRTASCIARRTMQQLLVLGHFSDGSIRDITKLADYLSSDEAVATVDADGFVTSAAIAARRPCSFATSTRSKPRR